MTVVHRGWQQLQQQQQQQPQQQDKDSSRSCSTQALGEAFLQECAIACSDFCTALSVQQGPELLYCCTAVLQLQRTLQVRGSPPQMSALHHDHAGP
jgi:hypothetical protein